MVTSVKTGFRQRDSKFCLSVNADTHRYYAYKYTI